MSFLIIIKLWLLLGSFSVSIIINMFLWNNSGILGKGWFWYLVFTSMEWFLWNASTGLKSQLGRMTKVSFNLKRLLTISSSKRNMKLQIFRWVHTVFQTGMVQTHCFFVPKKTLIMTNWYSILWIHKLLLEITCFFVCFSFVFCFVLFFCFLGEWAYVTFRYI